MHITIGNLLPNTVEQRPQVLFCSPYVLALTARQTNWKLRIRGSANSNWSAASCTPFPTEGANGSWYPPWDSKSLVFPDALSEIGEKSLFSTPQGKKKSLQREQVMFSFIVSDNYLLAVNIHSPISVLTNQTVASTWKSCSAFRTKCQPHPGPWREQNLPWPL